MASSFCFLLLLCSLIFCFISPAAIAKTSSSKPRTFVLPVTKDSSTLQHVTHLSLGTPFQTLKLTVEISGQSLWFDCEQDYVSSSYKPVYCNSTLCYPNVSTRCRYECGSDHKPGCNDDTCLILTEHPHIYNIGDGELSRDVIAIQTTDGSNPGKVVSVPNFLFGCATSWVMEGFPKGVKGQLGLGRSSVSLPTQLSSTFGIERKFAVCLSSSTKSNGVIFFGRGPYNLLPNIDVSKSLLHTPLIINPYRDPEGWRDSTSYYYIGVTSIKVNGKPVNFNTTLLSINKQQPRYGGTKIDSTRPYTALEYTIYEAVTEAFVKELADVPRVKPVEPFETCFNSKHIDSTRLGPAVPPIDLVLQDESVYWRISGANSMVRVKREVLCLGFIKAFTGEPSVNIGAHQLEDNLLQFDLANKRLGFSNSLLGRQTTCSNFNFTSNA